MSKRRISDKLGKFRRLEWRDKWLLLRAAAWLLVARLLILAVPFPRLARRASTEPGTRAAPPPELVERIGYAISAAANNVPWRSDCFPQCLAASKLLSRHGYPSTIHLGVEKHSDRGVAGHAWLTCGDNVVTGGEDLARYTEMHRISA